ncbi:MAG: translational GTPase TypA [Verrucomicrobiota bacterium]|nr:translational GTPase TypA [Verrucomicrobiota bacterium]MDP6252195.1 translational GTPase TypA [Verrucomicrobiota bacterium]MDP7179166.1 translational GTPase TypA [Verrucomicrobiota bacterium]MDP7291273.1 translational GTPase TypA [Verrucomicrobiota bacterium]HJN82237.1 translational GTPase TypA [Verrucomicrobiota bacterium]
MKADHIRNIAIIAHVDHGKTTLVDELLQQSGTFRDNQVVAERVMDSMDLEREKGITIKAKNTAINWKDYTINIVDTPGHADFGAEVERVMKMVDGVLLLTDAVSGPQAQTRWVLRKALGHGLKTICVVNKIDRDTARPEWVHDKVLELFLELGADDEQFNAPFLYGSAKRGFVDRKLDGPRRDMNDLFETVIERVPPPVIEDAPFRMLVSNIDWDDYVGRLAIGRILSGDVKQGDALNVLRRDGTRQRMKVIKLKQFAGLQTNDVTQAGAGDIASLAGFDEIDIGDTLAKADDAELLPFVEIDPATVQMEFAVNDGPLAGRDGKKVTSREIRARLERETKSNISISVHDTDESTRFLVDARGSMQIAVLLETMRREGYEVLVSRPTVLFRDIDGKRCEPFEQIWIEVPEAYLGTVMENLSKRLGKITNTEHHTSGVTVSAEIPTRGLIGFESDLVTLTSGNGVMSHLFLKYSPYSGELVTRSTGTLVSMENGISMAYALDMLQARGSLFVSPGDKVYAGQVVGENSRRDDLPVNPTKAKHLDNMRSSGADKAIMLTPPINFSIERAIEYIDNDELVEVTPKHLRFRKRILDANDRRKAVKRARDVALAQV